MPRRRNVDVMPPQCGHNAAAMWMLSRLDRVANVLHILCKCTIKIKLSGLNYTYFNYGGVIFAFVLCWFGLGKNALYLLNDAHWAYRMQAGVVATEAWSPAEDAARAAR